MSTYVPFFRRFTDEKGRDIDEARQLYAWVKARQDAFSETPVTVGILDMLYLMSDDAPYREAIARLPDIPREFFLRDFPSKTFQQTKEQIRYRLQAILENPTMARLFTSPETKVDLHAELNKGSIILVDTAKDYLKGASDNFGRIFISLTLQAILERAAIPAAERKDTFVFVDEAASYFDSNIDDLLTDARKYRCGLVLAHQYLDQASSSLKASLAANIRVARPSVRRPTRWRSPSPVTALRRRSSPMTCSASNIPAQAFASSRSKSIGTPKASNAGTRGRMPSARRSRATSTC